MRIAFGHKSRVGKDTAVNYLLKKYTKGSIIRFAQPVYDICGMIQSYMGYNVEKDPALLQFIGVGLRNLYYEDIWVSKALSQMENSKDIFIPDMRFPNEAKALKLNEFILVKINRKDRPIDRDPNHISEIAMDDYEYDYVIDNNGTVEEFYNKLDSLIKDILSKTTR